MRPGPLGLALALALLGPAVPRSSASAGGDPRLDAVVAKVGPTSITVGDLERRMRAVPRFQLATFGSTADEVKRNFLQKIVIPEALFAAGAKDRHVEDSPQIRDRIIETLRGARLSALRSELMTGGGVTQEDVQKYYDENKSRFDSPERVSVWRILCKTKDEAAQVIAEAKKSGSPARWSELAREHSTDTTTSMRAGNLGFLSPEGVSTDQGVSVAPEIVAAAGKLKDGEIGPEPVPEAGQFAVIWRRGSMPGVKRTVEQEQVAIRQVLVRKKLEQATKELVQSLRADHLEAFNPQLVESVEIDARGQLGPKGSASSRPAPPPPRKVDAKPAPSATPSGLR